MFFDIISRTTASKSTRSIWLGVGDSVRNHGVTERIAPTPAAAAFCTTPDVYYALQPLCRYIISHISLHTAFIILCYVDILYFHKTPPLPEQFSCPAHAPFSSNRTWECLQTASRTTEAFLSKKPMKKCFHKNTSQTFLETSVKVWVLPPTLSFTSSLF